jgi:hypothetical protein
MRECFPIWERGSWRRSIDAIAQDVDCKQFHKWHPGINPLDVLKMIENQELIQRQSLDEARRDAREERRDEANRRHQWMTLGAALSGVVLSACGVIFTAYSTLFKPVAAPVINNLIQPPAVIIPPEPKPAPILPPPVKDEPKTDEPVVPID